MLSKSAKRLALNFLKNSFRLSTPLYSQPTLYENLSNSTQALTFSNPRFHFSTSDESNKDDKSDKTAKEDSSASTSNIKEKAGRKATKVSKKESPQKNSNNDEKKLKAVALRPTRLPLEEDEKNAKLETYVLFSSPTPIIPFSQQQGFVRTGNLGANHISNKLAFFIQNDLAEIYTIGLILENDVNKSLKKNFNDGSNPTANSLTLEKNKHKANIITKAKNYKVKLVEIEFRDNCIFAKGIPYKDAKLTAEEKQVNILNVLIQIKNIILSLKGAISHEKLDVFNNINFDNIHNKDFSNDDLDEMLCLIVGECYKLSSYTKENLTQFIQAFFEQRSIIARLFMVRKKLDEIKNVLDIVNKSIQFGDEQIWKYQDQAKAKLSLDYIKSNYFSGDLGGNAKGQNQNSSQDKGANNTASNQNLSPQAKKYMDKLELINAYMSN